MIDFFKPLFLIACVGLLGLLCSCKDDPKLPDNLVQFESDQLGFSAVENDLLVNIAISRAIPSEGNITIQTELTGLTYGVDFVTDPAASANSIGLVIPANATSIKLKISKVAGVLFDGNEQIKFTLLTASSGLVLGSKKQLTLSFSEIVATQATVDPAVGGELEPNKVFIDLSANRQQSIARNAWDLGFYTVDGQFRVIVNTSSSMLVRQITKNDLTAVTPTDTIGFGAQLSTDAIFAAITSPAAPPAWLADSKNWVDDPTGDMTKTAISEVASVDGDNKVYIVNQGKNPDGTQRGWKKIRIIRKGTGYTLQHADIGATSFSTLQVVRNDAYLFNYISFATGLVEVEPQKEQWDIAFTVFTNITAFSPTTVVPYVFLDVVLQNRYQVQTVQVLNSTVTYENFTEANLTGLVFNSSQINIGSSWRSGGGPSGSPALRTDRFYVVKDTKGNIYKLKFTALTQGGERGKPQIQFALVKKAI